MIKSIVATLISNIIDKFRLYTSFLNLKKIKTIKFNTIT